jgi:hypothetical protein
MKIGRISIEADGSAHFDGVLIGKISRLVIDQDALSRRGSISISPVDRSVDFIPIAREMAMHNLLATFDFDGEFWPNSYTREGQWYAETSTSAGIITNELGVSAAIPAEYDEHYGKDTMLGTY